MGEMTVPSQDGYEADVHLKVEDVAVYDSESPNVMRAPSGKVLTYL